MCLKESGLHVRNTITILGSIVNITGAQEGPIQPFNEHENLHFHNEQDVRMSSENYAEKGYGLNGNFANNLVLILCFTS